MKSDKINIKREDFFKMRSQIKKISIVTAYIDLKTLDWIFKYANKNKTIKIEIFVDRYSSKCFSNKKIYDKLIKVSEKCKNINIYLVKLGKLFHSKLYYFKSTTKIKIAIGSLNFTYNAFHKNEEILSVYEEKISDKSEYVQDIQNYIASIQKNNSEIITSKLENNYPKDDLRSLLLDGHIYYESKEQESFSFKLKLPEEFKKLKTNIDASLESKIVDSLTLERLVQESKILKDMKFPAKDTTRHIWKNNCVETCYGYWSPYYFNKDLQVILQEREDIRKPYFDEIKKILNDNELELEKAFILVWKNINKELKNSDWEYSKLSDAKKAWKKWRENLINKLDNESFYKRLTVGIIQVSPPDVWTDDIASEEFEDSFIESIIYYWSKENQKTTSNKPAKEIYYNLRRGGEFDKDIEPEQLKIAIQEWLTSYSDNDNNIFKSFS